MKQAIFPLAVFLSMNAAAQLPVKPGSDDIPAYQPIKFESLKKFKHNSVAYNTEGISNLHSFKLDQPTMPALDMKTLNQYLSEDRSYYRRQQKKKEWTEFGSGLSNEIYKRNWQQNKYNVQQKWMTQQLKGK